MRPGRDRAEGLERREGEGQERGRKGRRAGREGADRWCYDRSGTRWRNPSGGFRKRGRRVFRRRQLHRLRCLPPNRARDLSGSRRPEQRLPSARSGRRTASHADGAGRVSHGLDRHRLAPQRTRRRRGVSRSSVFERLLLRVQRANRATARGRISSGGHRMKAGTSWSTRRASPRRSSSVSRRWAASA